MSVKDKGSGPIQPDLFMVEVQSESPSAVRCSNVRMLPSAASRNSVVLLAQAHARKERADRALRAVGLIG